MKKLIAKTLVGKEFMHSRQNAFFVMANAKKIVDALNDVKYKLKDGECWYLYDYDYGQEAYTTQKIYLSSDGSIRVRNI